MAKTIKIAPDLDEIYINDEKIVTEWNGGITYKADLSAIRNAFKDDWLKSQFHQAIALVSKPWQLENILQVFHRLIYLFSYFITIYIS